MERTLILVKPDAFARNLTGEIIARFERKGLRLVALNLMTMTRELAGSHYAEHVGKGFYEELVSFITSGPLVAMAGSTRSLSIKTQRRNSSRDSRQTSFQFPRNGVASGFRSTRTNAMDWRRRCSCVITGNNNLASEYTGRLKVKVVP